MANVANKFIRNRLDALRNDGNGLKVAAMNSSEFMEFMASHLSPEYVEQMNKDKKQE
jgi:predicted house-cleaning noncanonical NTP pyrophosphatase (MazG superfamily)